MPGASLGVVALRRPAYARHTRQCVHRAPVDAVRVLHGKAFACPVLEAADHLAHAIAELCEGESPFGPRVAARTPAVDDNVGIRRDLPGSAIGDVPVGKGESPWQVSLRPRLKRTDVDDGDVLTGLLRRVQVAGVGLMGELFGEVVFLWQWSCSQRRDVAGPAPYRVRTESGGIPPDRAGERGTLDARQKEGSPRSVLHRTGAPALRAGGLSSSSRRRPELRGARRERPRPRVRRASDAHQRR